MVACLPVRAAACKGRTQHLGVLEGDDLDALAGEVGRVITQVARVVAPRQNMVVEDVSQLCMNASLS